MAGEAEGTPVETPDTTPAPEGGGEGQPEGGAARDDKGRFAPKTNGSGDPAVEPQPDAEPVADWRKDLPEDLAKTAQKFNSPVDALKSYRELEQRLGKSVTLPGKDATPEEVQKFRERLGVPKDPTGYEVKIPEGLPDEVVPVQERLDAFKKAMHEAGATPQAVQAALDLYFQTQVDDLAAIEKSVSEAGEKSQQELEREWGQDYRANAAYAQRMVRHFDPDNRFGQFLETAIVDGRKLGDHPEFLRFFAAAGRAMTEDTVHLTPTEAEASTINQEITKVRQERNEALQQGNRQRAMELDERERQLYARRDGNVPIVGAGGRTA